MNPYFPSDTYDTPEDRPRDLMDRLCCGGPLWFRILYARVVFEARSHVASNRYDYAAWAKSSHDMLQNIERCGGRFHISGIDHIRHAEPPLVFVSNHMSTTETQVFPGLIAPFMPVTFIVKKSLVTMPIWGPIMSSRDPITVGRENPRHDLQTVMTEGRQKLMDGISLIVFPQSTRQLIFRPEEFNSLGVKLAQRAGVKVMPVAVKTDFWCQGRRLKDLGPLQRSKPIHMHFGAPIEIQGSGKEEHQAIVEFIKTHLEQWGAEVAK